MNESLFKMQTMSCDRSLFYFLHYNISVLDNLQRVVNMHIKCEGTSSRYRSKVLGVVVVVVVVMGVELKYMFW